MHALTAHAIVDMDMQSAWEKLSDLGTSHFYVPDLIDTQITTEQKQGVGTSRRIISKRPALIETVIEWDEGHGFKLRLHHDKGDGVPPLFSQATFEYRLIKETDTTTRLENTMTITMKWGMLGELLAKLIMNPIQKMQQQIVVGQKLYYETGQKVNKSDVIETIKNK